MIGDVLTSSILFEAIRTTYPDAQLHYLINSHTFPVVEGNPNVDDFIFFTPEIEKSKRKLLAFAQGLKKEKYDVVIDVYSKFSSNIITLFSGAKTKISKYKWYTSFIYSHTLKEAKTSKTYAGLAVENRLGLLQPLEILIENPIKPKIYLSEKEKNHAKKVLTENGIDLTQPLYMIGVLGSSISKTYPHDYMATVIDTIVNKQPNAQIIFNYIPKQKADADSIFNLCNAETQQRIHLNIFGKSLREFLALTSFCDALIGNEGGATNMAKALHIPTFTIFSPWILKNAWNMFDDDKSYLSVHLNDFKPELYTNASYKDAKQDYKSFYEAFSPDLFSSKLNAFISNL